jgi:hypothetical protein
LEGGDPGRYMTARRQRPDRSTSPDHAAVAIHGCAGASDRRLIQGDFSPEHLAAAADGVVGQRHAAIMVRRGLPPGIQLVGGQDQAPALVNCWLPAGSLQPYERRCRVATTLPQKCFPRFSESDSYRCVVSRRNGEVRTTETQGDVFVDQKRTRTSLGRAAVCIHGEHAVAYVRGPRARFEAQSGCARRKAARQNVMGRPWLVAAGGAGLLAEAAAAGTV